MQSNHLHFITASFLKSQLFMANLVISYDVVFKLPYRCCAWIRSIILRRNNYFHTVKFTPSISIMAWWDVSITKHCSFEVCLLPQVENKMSQVWWHIPIIPHPGGRSRKIMSSKPALTTQGDPASKTKHNVTEQIKIKTGLMVLLWATYYCHKQVS